MNSTIKNLLMFVLGFGLGATTAYLLVKNKYQTEAEEEINEVREIYQNRINELYKERKNKSELNKHIKNNLSVSEYAELIADSGYEKRDYSSTIVPEKPKTDSKPYIITQDDFMDEEVYMDEDIGYSKVTWYYYADGVLCNEDNEPVPEPQLYFHKDALALLDDDTIHVLYLRNDNLKIDYEILREDIFYEESIT